MRLIALIVLASALVIGLVELLNRLEAGPGIAAVAVCTTAVAGGSLLGYFADRLPQFPRKRAEGNSTLIGRNG
jgi:hypothetical protein